MSEERTSGAQDYPGHQQRCTQQQVRTFSSFGDTSNATQSAECIRSGGDRRGLGDNSPVHVSKVLSLLLPSEHIVLLHRHLTMRRYPQTCQIGLAELAQ